MAVFPSVQLYVLIGYLFVASAASAWLCLHFNDLIMKSPPNSQMWFYLSLFLTNNIFATVAAFVYWMMIEREESRKTEMIQEGQISSLLPTYEEAKIGNPYGMVVSYYDNVNYDHEEAERPSLI